VDKKSVHFTLKGVIIYEFRRIFCKPISVYTDAQAAARALCKKLSVRVADVGDGRQPNHLSKDELAKILG
jgi:hypothetical protein